MATVTRYVNTNSTAGGDGTTNGTAGATRAYASMSEWEAAEQTDLVTDTDLHIVNLDGAGGDDTTDIGIGGWTTGSANDITCQQNSAGTAYSLVASGSIGVLRLAEDYIIIDGIYIENTSTGSAAHVIDASIPTYTSADNNVVIKNCEVVGPDASSTTRYDLKITKANLVVDVFNCLVRSGSRGTDTRLSATANISFCTFYRAADNLGLICDTEAVVKSTYSGRASGTAEDFWTGGAAPSGSNNISSDTTATTDYTTSLVSKAPSDQFVTVGSDFHLKASSDCEAAGVTVSGITTDFEGDVRDVSTPDVGYDEFVAAAGGATGKSNPIWGPLGGCLAGPIS